MLLALALFFVRQGQIGYTEDQSPEGVLRNYMLAIQQQDYERAYQYLAHSPGMPDPLSFRMPFEGYQKDEISNTAVEIGASITNETTQTAQITITIIRGGRGLFEDVYREQQLAYLVRQDGSWKIFNAPYPYWSYDWPTDLPPENIPEPTATAP